MSSRQVDVLIIGGGPVGITGAILLAQEGLQVLVAEREATIYPLPRAAHLDHETIRILQAAGVVDELIPTTRSASRYDFLNKAGDILMRFETGKGKTSSGWPASNMIHQPSLETILRTKLMALPNAALHTQWEFTTFENKPNGISAYFSTPEGETKVDARYVIGCDGANSSVRQMANIEITDLGFDESWLVIDTLVKDARRLPDRNLQICDPARPTTCVLMGSGRHRWEFMLLDGETADSIQKPETIANLLEPWNVADAVEIERQAVYRFSAKLAKTWRQDRIMLAGDAAHLMPPFAGQGLCSGLRDVANLAWKLVLILKQGASDSLLESYQIEREPHVRAVIDLAIMMGQTVCITDPEMAAQRDAQLIANRKQSGDPAGAMDFPPLAQGCIRTPDPLAGHIAPQFNRSDDILGTAPCLLSRTSAQPETAIHQVTLDDPRLAPVKPDLEAWFTAHNIEALLIRGDKYIYGAGAPAELIKSYKAMTGLA